MTNVATSPLPNQPPSKPAANTPLKPLALKSLRQRMGWTQTTMSRFLGLSFTQYTRLEYGNGGINPGLMIAAERAFKALKIVRDTNRWLEVPIPSNKKEGVKSRKVVFDIARAIQGSVPVPDVIDSDDINSHSLRILREHLGWTQKEMAICIIYNRTYYAQLETGARSAEWTIIPTNIARTAILDALVEIVNAGREDEIDPPIESNVASLETTWRTIFNIAHEVRNP